VGVRERLLCAWDRVAGNSNPSAGWTPVPAMRDQRQARACGLPQLRVRLRDTRSRPTTARVGLRSRERQGRGAHKTAYRDTRRARARRGRRHGRDRWQHKRADPHRTKPIQRDGVRSSQAQDHFSRRRPDRDCLSHSLALMGWSACRGNRRRLVCQLSPDRCRREKRASGGRALPARNMEGPSSV
jgi:hypothetical protein